MKGLSRRVFVADRGDAGVRLDRVLLRRLADLPRVSRTQVQRWIEGGQVIVGGRGVSRAAARVAAGDEVAVCFPTPAPRARPAAEAHPLTVLFEDDDLIVVDKPAGLVVHPSYGHASGTLLNALLGRAADAGWTPRLAHRLDRQTSGVLIAAKHLEAHRVLTRAWPTAAVRKHYMAVVIGKPPRARGEIRLPLGRDPLDRRRVAVVASGGRESVTRYRVLASSRGLRAGLSLVACELLTGRMHQVRVHLAAVGCPIVGDSIYGRARLPPTADPRLAAEVAGLPRHALHAWRVDLHGPPQRPASFTAPLPRDMVELLARAGLDAGALVARLDAELPVERSWPGGRVAAEARLGPRPRGPRVSRGAGEVRR